MTEDRKTIVITGSSRGIGYHMAMNFLERGHRVVISGSRPQSTEEAYKTLREKYKGRVWSKACDVRDMDQVRNLCEYCVAVMGRVDVWINNAGLSHVTRMGHLMDDKTINEVLDVNIKGVVNGSKTAISLFVKQGYGALYNMEGLGSDGRVIEGQSIYSASKSFVRQYSRSLEKEAKGSPYIVGRLSPGMVTTELLLKDIEQSDNPEKSKKIFSILADHVTTVTPWLVERILNNSKNGALIAWLTTPKIIYRFMTAGFIKRNPF